MQIMRKKQNYALVTFAAEAGAAAAAGVTGSVPAPADAPGGAAPAAARGPAAWPKENTLVFHQPAAARPVEDQPKSAAGAVGAGGGAAEAAPAGAAAAAVMVPAITTMMTTVTTRIERTWPIEGEPLVSPTLKRRHLDGRG